MKYDKQNRMLAIFKAMANTNRIKILRLIHLTKSGKLSVNEIVAKMDISQPTISDHLKLMRIHKIVRAKQKGSIMHYSIIEPLVMELIGRME